MHAWETGSQAKAAIGSWITFYNHRRPHAAHGGRPPPWATSTESKPTGRHRL
ncbi:integrase core domain-containing protein [Rhodobacter sp. 24-YEA-8]|uniref:integrase core domain-containing protein n=1 Tax=Rhodobacter sp. 24-YEA-8 TaxID=1884310 RepID=UPI000B85FE8D